MYMHALIRNPDPVCFCQQKPKIPQVSPEVSDVSLERVDDRHYAAAALLGSVSRLHEFELKRWDIIYIYIYICICRNLYYLDIDIDV